MTDAATPTPDDIDGGQSRDSARSTLHSTLRHARTLALVDVRRVLRAAVDRKTQIVAFALVVVLFGGGLGFGAYLFGRELGLTADLGIGYTIPELARGGFGVLWLFLAVIVTIRTVGTRGDLDNDVGILSMVPTRDAAFGLVLSETLLAFSYTLPLALSGAIGYGLGSDTWTLAVTAPVVAGLATASAVAVAFPVGLAIRHVVTQIEFVVRHKGPLIALAFLAYMGLIFTDVLGGVVVAIFEPMQAAPSAWFVDLLLLGTPGIEVSRFRAIGSVLLVPVVVAGGVAASTRVADRHWFADPVLAGTTEDDSGVDPDTDRHDDGILVRIEDALGTAVGRGTAAITVLAWKRAIRAPLKLLYAAYPLLFGIGFIVQIVQTGEVPAIAPVGALVFVAWAGAVVFTLNPLGDQGSALPATVLSRIDGRSFVTAHLLAGALLVIPVGTLLVGALAVLAPLETSVALVLVLATPVSVIVGGLFAVGVGMAFPRYDAVNVTRSTKAVVPSLIAFAVFSASLVVVIAAAGIVYEPAFEPFVAALGSWLLPFGLSISRAGVSVAARVVLVPAAIAPFASVRYAIGRFDTVTVD